MASFSICFAESFVPNSFYEMLLARLIHGLQSQYVELTGNANALLRIEDQVLTRNEAILKLRTDKFDKKKDVCFRVTVTKVSVSNFESREALTVEVNLVYTCLFVHFDTIRCNHMQIFFTHG